MDSSNDASPVPPEPRKALSITRSGVIGTIIVLLVALACVRLGIWQLHRLGEKRTRNSAAHARLHMPPVRLTALMRDSSGLIYRRAIVSGTYDDEHTIVIAGRSLNGSPGVHVLTPLRIGNSAVLVNRGWVPSSDAASVDLSTLKEPSPQDAEALLLDLPQNPRAPAPDSAGTFRRVWYRFDLHALQREIPYPLADYGAQLLPSRAAPQLPRRLPPPELDEGPHLGYAIQWFSFAVIAIAGWIILLLRRGR